MVDWYGGNAGLVDMGSYTPSILGIGGNGGNGHITGNGGLGGVFGAPGMNGNP